MLETEKFSSIFWLKATFRISELYDIFFFSKVLSWDKKDRFCWMFWGWKLSLSWHVRGIIKVSSFKWGPSRACVQAGLALYHVININTRTWDCGLISEKVLSKKLTRLSWLIPTSFLPSNWNLDKIFALTGKSGHVHMANKIFPIYLHAGKWLFLLLNLWFSVKLLLSMK